MFESIMGSVDPTCTKINQPREILITFFSSKIFKKRKFTVEQDLQWSQTVIPNNVQNSSRH